MNVSQSQVGHTDYVGHWNFYGKRTRMMDFYNYGVVTRLPWFVLYLMLRFNFHRMRNLKYY